MRLNLSSDELAQAILGHEELQEQQLQTETEKLRLGQSTPLLVAQAQRDLTLSQLAEVQALVNYLKALVEIYRQ